MMTENQQKMDTLVKMLVGDANLEALQNAVKLIPTPSENVNSGNGM